MSDMILICRDTGSGTWNISNPSAPQCSGQLLVVESGLAFDPSQLDAGFVVQCFVAGLILAGIPMLTIFAGRVVLSTLFNKR